MAVLSDADLVADRAQRYRPYNACFDGDELAGVFDWDLAGPTTPLLELAFIAWNCVPLWRDDGPVTAARRLELIATSYRTASGAGGGNGSGGFSAGQILDAVPARIQVMLDDIPAAAAAGDQGMANLMALGEPGRSSQSLAALLAGHPGGVRGFVTVAVHQLSELPSQVFALAAEDAIALQFQAKGPGWN